MSSEEALPDPARGLRRWVAIGLVLALAGAGAALGIVVTQGSSAPKRSIFPARFSESGFLSGSARLDHSYDVAATRMHVTGALTAGRTSYIVALCDRGGMVVHAGSLTTSQPCTGRPEGVITLKASKTVTLTATMTEPQTDNWGLAIYH